MSSTHRKKIARGLARATGLTYQQALALVAEADDAGRLPRPLDDRGIARAIKMLADEAQPAPVAFPDLNMSSEDRAALAGFLATTSHGLVVVAGMTGTGKSAVMRSLIEHLADGRQRIVSLESPIEQRLDLPGVTQVDLGEQGIATFGDGIWIMRRRDPGVIVVDELRSMDDVENAVYAADSGHLTIVGLHAPDADAAARRLEQNLPSGAPGPSVRDVLRCVLVTTREGNEFSVKVRMFAPPAAAYDKRHVVDALNRLAALLRIGGLSSWASLEAVADSAPDGLVGAIFERVLPVIMGGGSWSDGFAESPEVFEPWAIALIRSGEERNEVPHALEEVARLL